MSGSGGIFLIQEFIQFFWVIQVKTLKFPILFANSSKYHMYKASHFFPCSLLPFWFMILLSRRSDVLFFSPLYRACQLSIKTHLLFFYRHRKTWLNKIYTEFCLFLGVVMWVSKLSSVECEHMSCLSQGRIIFGFIYPVLLFFFPSWNQDILPIWPNPHIP